LKISTQSNASSRCALADNHHPEPGRALFHQAPNIGPEKFHPQCRPTAAQSDPVRQKALA
jgi:hypothetical protein